MQDRTSANSMKVLLQRTAGPYIWVIFRQIEPLATPAECLLCSDRIQSFARRLNVVECQTRTAYATWHPQHGQPSLVLIPIRRA
jgi:hypothetical protein